MHSGKAILLAFGAFFSRVFRPRGIAKLVTAPARKRDLSLPMSWSLMSFT